MADIKSLDPMWEGFLTSDNILAVAKTISEMLSDKEFSIASVHNRNPEPMPSLNIKATLKKVEVSQGTFADGNFFLKLNWGSSNLFAEEMFFVRLLNSRFVDKNNSVWFDFSWNRIQIVSPRNGGFDYYHICV